MKINRKKMAGLLLAALLGLAAGGCGPRDHEGQGGTQDPPSQPTTITMATGTIATDDWGHTGRDAVQIKAPAGTEVTAAGSTLLLDASRVVVTGTSATTVIYSSDQTNLPAAAQSAAPGVLVSYLQILIGQAASALPVLSASVDAGSLATGTVITVYRYDTVTGRWLAPQATTVTAAGKISFSADRMGIYGVFR